MLRIWVSSSCKSSPVASGFIKAERSQNPDGNTSLELEGHERLNVRLIVGFGF